MQLKKWRKSAVSGNMSKEGEESCEEIINENGENVESNESWRKCRNNESGESAENGNGAHQMKA
jgi:hypothetical protein